MSKKFSEMIEDLLLISRPNIRKLKLMFKLTFWASAHAQKMRKLLLDRFVNDAPFHFVPFLHHSMTQLGYIM